jgi:hypothetical protein
MPSQRVLPSSTLPAIWAGNQKTFEMGANMFRQAAHSSVRVRATSPLAGGGQLESFSVDVHVVELPKVVRHLTCRTRYGLAAVATPFADVFVIAVCGSHTCKNGSETRGSSWTLAWASGRRRSRCVRANDMIVL